MTYHAKKAAGLLYQIVPQQLTIDSLFQRMCHVSTNQIQPISFKIGLLYQDIDIQSKN